MSKSGIPSITDMLSDGPHSRNLKETEKQSMARGARTRERGGEVESGRMVEEEWNGTTASKTYGSERGRRRCRLGTCLPPVTNVHQPSEVACAPPPSPAPPPPPPLCRCAAATFIAHIGARDASRTAISTPPRRFLPGPVGLPASAADIDSAHDAPLPQIASLGATSTNVELPVARRRCAIKGCVANLSSVPLRTTASRIDSHRAFSKPCTARPICLACSGVSAQSMARAASRSPKRTAFL